MAQEGYELEVIFKLKYKADPAHYDVEDTNPDVLPYKMARVDAEAFVEDPDAAFAKFVSSNETEITVAPVVHFDEDPYN